MTAPMANADCEICITLQMGLHKEHINVNRDSLDLPFIRQKAQQFIEKLCPNQAFMLQRILLFRHNYESPNVLQLLNDTDEINNGTVIEVVITHKNERPAHPHILNVHSYYAPTFCDYCGEILVGLVRQGLKCSKCSLNFHKNCAFAAHNNCSCSGGEAEPPDSTNFGLPHTFVVHTYKKPTVCKYCNNLLVGIVKQGLQCRDCKVNVHKKCASALSSDCRMDCQACVVKSSNDSMEVDTSTATEKLSSDGVVINSHHHAEEVSTGDLIQLTRIPGQAAIRHSRQRALPVLMEGWLLHFTNHNRARKRHYWVMDATGISLFHCPQGASRCYKFIPLGQILGLRPYNGPPIDPSGPPHCFEIQTAHTVYFVGENLDWYAKHIFKGSPAALPQLPRRESGVGLAVAQKWIAAIHQALLPPKLPQEKLTPIVPSEDADEIKDTHVALEFSNLYQINQQEELGSGQFGTVYGGVHRSTGRKVAIKVIMKSRFGRKQKEQLRSEVAILQNISNAGIITLEAMFETRDRVFVVMEKMEADMLEMILSSRLGRLSERITKFLIFQILNALKYLHSHDIAHCDLKPENVLLNSPDNDFPQTKLCDFGYARIIGENTFRRTVVGTPAYLAPEVLLKKGYNKSLDLWSVGVVIYVTLSGTFPFNEGEEIADQIKNAAFMFPPNPWNEISNDAIDLISQLLKVNLMSPMEERLCIEDCLAHKWLNDRQLYLDLRNLEQQLSLRYLTSPQDDDKYFNEHL
ncbi:unnamed protein product [Soboliphyme baturini]|uniref:protein kinase C n=1 Tax=Soboliphyme baturini TaxID=241478 RepID=A0A183IF30_9BILA|nr:unnamed protein product [Soboliphyme baturini]